MVDKLTKSGKSKEQFDTLAGVFRIIIIGIDKCSNHDVTVCEVENIGLI